MQGCRPVDSILLTSFLLAIRSTSMKLSHILLLATILPWVQSKHTQIFRGKHSTATNA